MRFSVDFQDERADFEVSDDHPASSWPGPAGVTASEASALVTRALENPVDFPALHFALVPGDRVVIALGAEVPEVAAVLGAVADVFRTADVAPESVTVLVPPDSYTELPSPVPEGWAVVIHDPADRTQLAYLAATTDERRVYLNRLLTDADIVLPIGRIGFDPVLGYSGPWGVIFPDLSDAETRLSYRNAAPADPLGPHPLFKESGEVSWLLGCQFQLGLVAGTTGLVAAVAGLGTAVMEHGARGVEEAWTVRADTRPELVVAGVGGPGAVAQIDDMTRGLATAASLVRRGGKIVVLSRAVGEPGPALRRLIAADDPRAGPSVLRGHESHADYASARRLAQALAWADVYLLSALDPDDVEGLSMIALSRPEEARRLVATSGSTLFISHADLARVAVADEAD